ncbi:hypothetical protein [Streptomyces aureus]|uniref:hypothetical protein n=1 Tax=Streptomyces aureus TaxID=193461 RepID=UPI00056BD88B|nr:hypothetical protein [Streptomyces aureus]
MPQESTAPPPVRQRNTTPYPYSVAETEAHPAYAVLPGDVAEFPALLDGWTAVGDEPEPAADDAAAKPPRKRAAAADTDTKDGGDPR